MPQTPVLIDLWKHNDEVAYPYEIWIEGCKLYLKRDDMLTLTELMLELQETDVPASAHFMVKYE